MEDSADSKKIILARVDEAARNLVERILNSDEMRQTGAVVPLLRVVIDSALGWFDGRKSERSILNFFAEVNTRLQLIEEDKLDKQFAKSPELEEIIFRCMRQAAVTQESERIKLYAKILTQTLILDNAKYRSNAEDFLILCSDLTKADLTLARAMYDQQKNIELNFKHHAENEISTVLNSGYRKLPEITALDKATFDLSMTKLMR